MSVGDEADLWCTRIGTGIPCLAPLGHGAEVLVRSLGPQLTSRIEFVFVEWRGTTRSTGSALDQTFDSISQDLDAVRLALGFEEVITFGQSIHGVFAAAYAARFPASVSHVVMVGTPARFPDPTVDEFWQADASPERKAVDLEHLSGVSPDTRAAAMSSRDAFVEVYNASRARTWYDPHFDDSSLWDGVPMNMDVPLRIFRDLVPGWDAATDLADLATPVFVALGRHDYRTPHGGWAEVASKLTHVRTQVFPRSGHWCHAEQPDEFAAELFRFLA